MYKLFPSNMILAVLEDLVSKLVLILSQLPDPTQLNTMTEHPKMRQNQELPVLSYNHMASIPVFTLGSRIA